MIVTTERDILTGSQPITLVIHSATDDWMFLSKDVSYDLTKLDMSVTTTLDVLLKTDPSINQLAGLPTGWKAVRNSQAGPWRSSKFAETEAIQ